MHSPRLQMKKKGELSPRTLQPVVAGGKQQLALATPSPGKGNVIGYQNSTSPSSNGGDNSSGMTSDAIAGLLGKYRTTIDNDVHITAAELSGIGGPNRTAQEIARVAQALAPRKPDEPPPPDPYQDVGSRVFDFMKKSPPQPPVVSSNSASGVGTSPRQNSFAGGGTKYVGSLAPLTYSAPIAVDAPPMFTSAHQQQQQVKRNLAPLPPREPSQTGRSIPLAPSTKSSVAVSTTARFIAPDERALALIPAASTTTGGGGALTIVQSPRDALPASPNAAATKKASFSDLLQEIETTTKDETLTMGTELSSNATPATSTFVDPEARRERLVYVLNDTSVGSEGDAALQHSGSGGVKVKLEVSKLANHIAFLAQQLLYLAAASPTTFDAALTTFSGGTNPSPISASAVANDITESNQPSSSDIGNASSSGSGGDTEPFEVTVTRNGRVLWKASSQEVDLSSVPGVGELVPAASTVTVPTAGKASSSLVKGGAPSAPPAQALTVTEDAEEAWLLSDNDGAVDLDASIHLVKTRARKAYTKAVAGYKLKLTQQRDVIAKLKSQIETTQAGGTKFSQLEEDLQIVREECRKQLGKIKTLVSLLDRAGQTIRFHEDQRHADALGNAMRKEGAAQWPQVRRIIPALDVEPPRTDGQILTDVVRFMDQQEDKLAEYSSHTEQLTGQLEEAQSAFEALQRTTKALQRDLEQTKFELEALRQRRKFEQDERSSTLATAAATPQQHNITALASTTTKALPGGGLTPMSTSLNSAPGGGGAPAAGATKAASEERLRLMERITSLESALKATTELKSTFTPLGVVDSIPAFLRFPKANPIRNIQLSKMEVENIICGIWLTRFLSSVTNSKPITDSGWVCLTDGSGVDVEGKKVTSNFANGAAVVKSLERMFTLAVQTVFTSAAAGSSAGSFYGRSTSEVVSASPPNASSTTTASAPGSLFGSPTSAGPQLSPDRHPACDFTDDNNIALWQVKRSEAKRVVNMIDHVTRFLLECIQPAACKTCLTLYTIGSGISTPPIATLQWQKRTDLFLQCPQVPTLFRGQGTAVPEAVAEVAYSFMDGCEKYNFDGDINMFRRILHDEIPEAAYFDMMLMVEKLRGALINSHTLYAAPYRWPTPTVATVLHMLKRFFPKKSRTSLLQLQRSLLLDMKETAMNIDAASLTRMMRSASNAAMLAAATSPLECDGSDASRIRDLPRVVFGMDVGDDTIGSEAPTLESDAAEAALRTPVDVVKLFASSESGNQGYFVESLKSQYMNELMRYTQEVREAVFLCGEELTQQQLAKDTAVVTTGIAMIDAAPQLSTLEKSKKRRSTVASYFQKQLAALTSSGEANDGGPFAGDGADVAVPLRFLADKLQQLDPAKTTAEVESYIYHVLQLYFVIKSKNKGGLSGSSSAISANTAAEQPATPLTTGGLTPAEAELFSLSKEELWKRQTRAASYCVSVADFSKYSVKVLYRRGGVDFHEQQQ